MQPNEFTRAARNPRWQIAAVLALAAVIVVAVLGGFREANLAVPHRGVGQRVGTGALAITIRGAWLDTRGPSGYPDTITGRHYLVLDAVAENLTTQGNAWYLRDDVRWLRNPADQKGAEADAIYLADDGAQLSALQPDLPAHVLLAWKVPPNERAGTLRFGLYQRSYYPKAYISNESGWLQDGPGALFQVQVVDRRAPAQVSP